MTLLFFEVSEELSGHRLDYAVSRELGLSRTYAAKLIKDGCVSVSNLERVKPSAHITRCAKVEVNMPPVEELDLEPEDIYFQTIYEDADIAVINKPSGLVVHPAPGHWTGTLVHGLLYKYPDMQQINGVKRPGIVHRLDAGTSGLMVVAKNGLATEELVKAFKNRAVEKHYIALLEGKPQAAEGLINLPIGRDKIKRSSMTVLDVSLGGREAKSFYKVLWSKKIKKKGGSAANAASAAKTYSLVDFNILTGRTHQIRVHAAALNCPVAGDGIYGHADIAGISIPRLFLHSWKLAFSHPTTKEPMKFTCPIGENLKDILKNIM